MPEICSKCAKPKQASRSGSITQWLSSCNCDLQPVDNEQAESLHLCQNCGKRIASGRVGSMTQWVFRQENCQCHAPKDIRRRLSQDSLQSPFRNDYQDEEEGLKLDPKTFPVERFKALMELGGGGAGKVYLCRDKLLRKRVAVKTLRQLDSEQLISFQQEARATSALTHPNIVNIFDFGVTESGAPYMVLDYVEGESLSQLIEREGRLPWKDALNIGLQLSRALAYAHGTGIYHRDLKPPNILLTRSGEPTAYVRLIDFGVAKIQESQEPTFVNGRLLVGTPAYMSPDQMAGLQFDARSEIYSFGCVLYEMLIGQPPFIGQTPMETMAKQANDPIPRLDGVTEAPPGMQVLLDRCLAKNPDDRFFSAVELGAAIEQILSSDSSSTDTASDTTDKTEQRFSRKTPALIILVILAIFAGGIGYLATKGKNKSTLVPVIDTNVKTKPLGKFASKRGERRLWLVQTAKISDGDLKELKGRQFENLNLESSQLSGSGLQYIEASGVLDIQLDGTAITDESCKYISRIKTIRRLSLKNTRVTIAGLKQLSNLDLLSLKLTYSGNTIDDDCVSFAQKTWQNLDTFECGDTAVTAKSIPTICKMKGLDNLEFGSITATPEQWRMLFKLPLLYLDVANSNVGRELIPDLAKMTTLRHLSVENCRQLTEADIVELEKALGKRCRIARSTTVPADVYQDIFDTLGDKRELQPGTP